MGNKAPIRNYKYAAFWMDPTTGLILNCNKPAVTLLEKKKSDIIGSHQRTIHPPEKADYYADMLNTQVGKYEPLILQAEVLTGSGSVKPVQIYASMTLVAGKQAIQGIFEDISDRNKVAEALEISELRYRRLFETAKDGIIILDAESGVIDDINPFLENMLGYSRESLVGKKLWQIGPMKDVKACKKAFLELQTVEYIRYENLPQKNIKKWKNMLISGTALQAVLKSCFILPNLSSTTTNSGMARVIPRVLRVKRYPWNAEYSQ